MINGLLTALLFTQKKRYRLKKVTTAEILVSEVQQWGQAALGVSYILQMDFDMSNERDLKFMIVTNALDDYIKRPLWLAEFGSYTKCHKASHGLFHVLKVCYTSGVTISFVLVEDTEKKDVYSFGKTEELEENVRMLVQKT